MLFLEKVEQKKIYIILVLVVCMIIGGIYALVFVPKTQVASTTLLCLKIEKNEDGTVKNNGTIDLDNKMVANFEEIAKSQLTIDEANKDINMNVNSNQIKFNKIQNSDTFNIELKNMDEENIVKFSNSLVEVFSKKVEALVGNIEIYVVDTPHIENEIFGSCIFIYPLVGLGVGIIISIIYIITLISLDKKIKNSKEIETDLSLKNLCYIPMISKKKNVELIYDEINQPEFSNIFNTLRANIQFVNVNNRNKNTILITSPKNNEGKSFVAVNLAAAFAQIGKKVILIDADMNLGKLDKIFNVPNGLGFSNYLANLDDNGLEINELVNKYIKETGVKNLNLITSGTVPPNSAELLASPRLEELLKDLTVFYDVVILDAGSALLRTDSLILARNINSTILVSNLKKTDKDDLWQVKKDIQNVGGRIIGNVLNKTKDKQIKLRTSPNVTKVKHNHDRKDFEKVVFKVKETFNKIKESIKGFFNKDDQKLLNEPVDQNKISTPVFKQEDKKDIIDKKDINIEDKKEINNEVKESSIHKFGSEVKGIFKNFNLLNSAKNFWNDDDIYVKDEKSNNDKVQEAEKTINEEEIKFEVNKNNYVDSKNLNSENKNVENPEFVEEHKNNQSQELFNNIYETSKHVLDLSKNSINTFSNKVKGIFSKSEKNNNVLVNEDNKKIDNKVSNNNVDNESKVITSIVEEQNNIKTVEDVRNNEDSVLVLLDGQNGMCRVFNKYCCLDKPIRGIDSVDGIEKANYSSYVLRKNQEKIMKDHNLTKNQVKRIDLLIYFTLKDYDDKIWLKRKVTSSMAENYIKCMSLDFEYCIGETELGYLRKCQELRRIELRKHLIEIEYKLDNMWSSNKMNLTDKIVLNNYAGNFDCDNKLKLFRNELVVNEKVKKDKANKEKLSDKIKNKLIDIKEKYLNIQVKQVEAKSIEEIQKELEIEKENKANDLKMEDNIYMNHLCGNYNYDENSADVKKEEYNVNNYNKEEQEKIKEIELLKEKKKEEKAILKQMKIEERKAKKIERIKRREELKKNKEIEKQKHKQEVRLEEELLGDNLYPKTKNNKDI